MFIVINKDGSIATIAPSRVYQGSNEAAVLGIFAPFSMSSFPTIAVNVELPSGVLNPPLTASPASKQPDGFGAWTLPLPSVVTAESGTVKISFAFIGANNQRFTTEAAEITVEATVPLSPPDAPDKTTYDQLIEVIGSLSKSMRADWTQSSSEGLGYIANKPTINPGSGTVASGEASAAFGENTVADALAAFVAGSNSIARGEYSTVFGVDSEARAGAHEAFVAGSNLKAELSRVFVCGSFNDYNSTAIFQIGSGEDEANRKNAFEVFNDGRIKCSRLDMFNSSDAGNFVVIGQNGELTSASIPVGGAY